MELKRKLEIAREIAMMQDFVNADEEKSLSSYVEELNQHMRTDFTEDEVSQVLEEYDGYSLSSIEELIIEDYFKKKQLNKQYGK